MNIDFITTETLTDDQILKEFGEALLYGEGKFVREDFFETIEGYFDICGSPITDSSKKEIIKQLKVLLTKLIEEL